MRGVLRPPRAQACINRSSKVGLAQRWNQMNGVFRRSRNRILSRFVNGWPLGTASKILSCANSQCAKSLLHAGGRSAMVVPTATVAIEVSVPSEYPLIRSQQDETQHYSSSARATTKAVSL